MSSTTLSAPAGPAQGPINTTHSPWRALVVDDHAMVRQMIRVTLESYSDIIEVVGEAADGVEAVTQAAHHRPDIVLMDVNLPEKSGVDATREIKHVHPDAVIMGISAEYSPQNYNAMMAAGAVAFVRKDDAGELLFRTIVYAMINYCPSHIINGRGAIDDRERAKTQA